jgi:hypothetical protein
MAARWEPPLVEKTGLSRLQPYDNWRECRTVLELAAIAENPNAIHMEGLCIRERILGTVGEYDNFGLFLRPSIIALYKKSSLYF